MSTKLETPLQVPEEFNAARIMKYQVVRDNMPNRLTQEQLTDIFTKGSFRRQASFRRQTSFRRRRWRACSS